MRKVLALISLLGLLLVIVPACLYLAGGIGKPRMMALMLAGTIVWFLSSPFWMGKNDS